MGEWDAWIGREERLTDRVGSSRLARFYATIGGSKSDIAPPGFHWCLCAPSTPTSELAADGHPEKGEFLPPVPLPRRMWAASEVSYEAQIRTGAAIERVATIRSITEKSGKSGSLVFVEVEYLIYADGVLAIREDQTIVYREHAREAAPLPETGKADLGRWPHRCTVLPDEALLFRYSAITFNSHRIHYDMPYASDIEGYPALVVHGPLTATLLLNFAAEINGTDAIARFAVRAVSPAFAGQPLHLAARETDGAIFLAALGDDGRTVMDARAEGR